MNTNFTKEQFAGVDKSFYDFASRCYVIDNLLAGSAVSSSAFKSLYPIHVFDVSKQSERLTEGVVDLTLRHTVFNPLIKFHALYVEERQISTLFVTTALSDKN